jgi:hypothetical protein
VSVSIFQKEQRLTILKQRLADKKAEEAIKMKECSGVMIVSATVVPTTQEQTPAAATFNNNCEAKVVEVSSDGLRNRTHLVMRSQGHDEAAAADDGAAVQSAVSDLERTASLRGITVLRGHVPKRTDYGDDHVESYL